MPLLSNEQPQNACRFKSCTKGNTLVGGVDTGEVVYVGAKRYVRGKPLYLPLNFSVNLKPL